MDAPSYESIEKAKQVDIQIGSMAPEQVKSGTTEQVPLQNEQSNASVKKEDSLAQSKDQVRKNLPAAEKNVQKQENVWIKSNSRAQATQRLEENGKFWGDSSLMKQIKQTMNVLNESLVEQMPREKAAFQRETELRTIRYDSLYALCEKYVQKRTGTHREPGATRLKLITEIRDYIGVEKDNFAEHAQQIYQMCEQQEHMPFWTTVLDSARALQTQGVPQGCTFTEKTALDERQTEAMKKRAAVSRVARLLNMEDMVENVRTTKVTENGEQKEGFLTTELKANEYMTFSEVKNLLKKPENKNVIPTYMPDILRDLMRIRDMDQLLGIKREDDDLKIKYDWYNSSSGTRLLLLKRAVAVNNDKLFQAPLKQQYERFVDREHANRLLALPKEIMEGAMLDLVTKSERETMKEHLSRLKSRVQAIDVQYQDVDSYGTHHLELIEELSKDNQFVQLDEAISADPQTGYLNKLPIVWNVQPHKGQEELQKLVEGDQATEISKEWGEVRDAAEKFFETWKEKKYGAKENEAIKTLLDKMRVWESAAKTTEQEQQMFAQYRQKITGVWGDAVFQKGKKTLTNPKFDDSMLESATYIAKKNGRLVDGKLGLYDRSGEPLFAHIPCETDLKQGLVGNCYFMSALTSIVKNSPKAIMDMMVDNGDSVTVKFPKRKPVTVSKKIVAKFTADGKQKVSEWYARDTLWVQIMEKAYVVAGFRESTQERYSPAEWNKIKNSVECMRAGEAKDVVRDLIQVEFDEIMMTQYTVDNMGDVFNSMWKRVIAYEQKDQKQDNQNVKPLPEKWKDIKTFLVQSLYGDLVKELKYRQQTTFKVKNKAKGTNWIETQRAAYRTITVEDVQETLKDMRNWRVLSEKSYFNHVMKALRDQFPDVGMNQEMLDRCLEQLGQEFDLASEQEQDRLEYRRQVGKAGPVHYTKKAVSTFQMLDSALKQNKLVMAGTKKFKPRFAVEGGAGLNGEAMREGMAQGHAYVVIGCVAKTSKDNVTKYFVRLRNPWGTGTVAYAHRKNVDGSEHTVGIRQDKEADGGIFDLDLNDFMEFVDSYQISKDQAQSNPQKA